MARCSCWAPVLIIDFRPITGGDNGLPLSFEGAFFGFSQAQLSKPEGFWPVARLSLCGVMALAYTAFASPELLDFSTGGNALVSTLIGGVGTVGGPALGALLYVIGQDRFGATGNLELLTGLGVVLVIYVFPDGIMGFICVGAAKLSGRGASGHSEGEHAAR